MPLRPPAHLVLLHTPSMHSTQLIRIAAGKKRQRGAGRGWGRKKGPPNHKIPPLFRAPPCCPPFFLLPARPSVTTATGDKREERPPLPNSPNGISRICFRFSPTQSILASPCSAVHSAHAPPLLYTSNPLLSTILGNIGSERGRPVRHPFRPPSIDSYAPPQTPTQTPTPPRSRT